MRWVYQRPVSPIDHKYEGIFHRCFLLVTYFSRTFFFFLSLPHSGPSVASLNNPLSIYFYSLLPLFPFTKQHNCTRAHSNAYHSCSIPATFAQRNLRCAFYWPFWIISASTATYPGRLWKHTCLLTLSTITIPCNRHITVFCFFSSSNSLIHLVLFPSLYCILNKMQAGEPITAFWCWRMVTLYLHFLLLSS